MNKVKVNLKHCYGIKSLQKEFDFTASSAVAIYAPNGVMKSSFAATFLDATEGKKPVDRIFPKRTTVCELTDDTGAAIAPKQILVIVPYNEFFDVSEGTATLLIEPKLRKEYENLMGAVNDARGVLLTKLQKQARSKRDFKEEITKAFTDEKGSSGFDLGLTRITRELGEQKDAPYSDVPFDVVFHDKVEAALGTPDMQAAIEDYVRRYNDLLAKSTYFKKGTFDYYNASEIAKSLASHGFFTAKHTVSLNAESGNQQISTQAELEAVIQKEKDEILKDGTLKKKFDDVATKLNKNAELRAFCHYLQNKEELLSRMSNLKGFKAEVLKSYLKANNEAYLDWLAKFDAAATRRKEMEAEAAATTSQWEKVIDIFNDRFTVPFTLSVKNKIQLTLGYESIVDVQFTYNDGSDSALIERRDLIKALSNGEKKALYILYLIFEIEVRMASSTETLVVVDDIADSFDYQNKYAIIQYLKDISEHGLFKLIIMTHNFDFFRTIESRFVDYNQCLNASKGPAGILLTQATGIKNVFAKEWKPVFFTNNRAKIASISFLRNLVEMTVGIADPTYVSLTNMLHWKVGATDELTVKNLDDVFNQICAKSGASAQPTKLIADLVTEEAMKIIQPSAPAPDLAGKIVLAIAIRMAAERNMIHKIGDSTFVAAIKKDQTAVLVTEYKKRFKPDLASCKTLDQVALMTPENIHVNSFMYEPIIDMGAEPLINLYSKVLALKACPDFD
jgi:ABC-type lipoprotein export system ATPase subunit